MKKFILPFILLSQAGYAQQHFCAMAKQHSHQGQGNALKTQAISPASHELKYDVKFVHLNLQLERTSTFVKGNVKTVAKVTVPTLDTFMTLLHANHTIDSIRFNGTLVPFTRQDSMVKIKVPGILVNGSTFTTIVHYSGVPPVGGSAIGSGYNQDPTGWYGNAAAWSLSESLVAYHWWPCKQVLTDKIDSSWVFVTTDSTNKVGSNGRLQNVVVTGNKKRYEWKSRAPIDYYLISVAVAEYLEYKQYAKPQYLPNDSILIQNYIYKSAWSNSSFQNYDKLELDKMPMTMEFLCDIYGMYPFYKEKYGHCMGSFGGGMEHQTMTTLGFFDFVVDAHELGHQWWGDNVTCKSWGDIWINEGFASYTEGLVLEYLDPPNFAGEITSAHNYVMSQNGGSCYIPPADTLNTVRIFDSRLTYAKGGAIIHSLRFVTNNDSLWFNTLRGFQATYKNSTASVIDFKNYYQAQTGTNPSQFFNQWYYGEGYPIFKIWFNQVNNVCWIKSVQSVTMPSVTPLFITPMEYLIKRTGLPDTTVRVMHGNATETYSFAVSGPVTTVLCDPNNWIINKTQGPIRDTSLGGEVGVKELNLYQELLVSPNPTRGKINISNQKNLQGDITVSDLSGKVLAGMKLQTFTEIDLTAYPEGIYFVRITDPNGEQEMVHKIIRQ
jgi:aminopeptidase N